MKLSKDGWILFCTAFVASCAMALAALPPFDQSHTLALLVADGTSAQIEKIWLQAASEEGVKLDVVTASQFLRTRQSEQQRYAGIIVPDTIHRNASAFLTESLRRYVHHGGKLMLVFDALTYDLNGAYAGRTARLSDATGVEYALYDEFGEAVIQRRPVIGSASSIARIGIPPGRTEAQRAVSFDRQLYDQWMTTYHYDELQYPVFQTGVVDAGTDVLLVTPEAQIVAARHASGKGQTLFVNLPLGLLKNSTDGLLLHSFLRYFSDSFVGFPRLLSAPDGIGGLILNIHVDNGYAIKSLHTLQQLGVFDQGPYSIHFTAGPDVNRFGDGFGMDALHDRQTQQWIRYLQARGNAIGNHGGWIHNYFGTRINADNGAEYAKYLTLNNDALQHLTGQPITEYSAPIGNQPLWVTRWLAEHRVLTYYTTSNLGMGPTRMFLNDTQIDTTTWSIPVTPFGRIASFEEAMFAQQAAAPLTDWLVALGQFVADNQTIRQIYCHPIGVPYYADSMRKLLESTKSMAAQHRFNWHTMTDIANFMSRREQVRWRLTNDHGATTLHASHDVTLAHMSWRVPRATCVKPRILQGQATIAKTDDSWQINAGDVKTLAVTCVVEVPLGDLEIVAHP